MFKERRKIMDNDSLESIELCDVCKRIATNMCEGCNFSVYCSEKCQQQDWSDHQLYCHIAAEYDISLSEDHSLTHDDDDNDDVDIEAELEYINARRRKPIFRRKRKTLGDLRAKEAKRQRRKARARRFKDKFSKKKEGGGRRLKRWKRKGGKKKKKGGGLTGGGGAKKGGKATAAAGGAAAGALGVVGLSDKLVDANEYYY